MSWQSEARQIPRRVWIVCALFLTTLAYLIASSFARPELLMYEPSPALARVAGDTLLTTIYTIDARDSEAWAFFDFSSASAVRNPGPSGWDLAVRRYRLVVNGGPQFGGRGGAREAVGMTWPAVDEAWERGYAVTTGSLDGEPVNPALDRWYRYDFFAHTLESRGQTYVVRTAEGRYAKFRVLSYYCPEATPGCLTIEYTFQGDGSRRLVP